MGILKWFRSPTADIGRKLPKYWESVRSFTIIIPFSEHDVPALDATLLETLKVRHALLRAYHAKYFPDKIYSSVRVLRERGEPLGPELDRYWETANNEAATAVAEKTRILLLHDNASRRLVQAAQEAVVSIANKHPECDVIDFGGDPLVRNPRQGVVPYAGGGKVLFLEPGAHLSDKEITSILVRHTV